MTELLYVTAYSIGFALPFGCVISLLIGALIWCWEAVSE